MVEEWSSGGLKYMGVQKAKRSTVQDESWNLLICNLKHPKESLKFTIFVSPSWMGSIGMGNFWILKNGGLSSFKLSFLDKNFGFQSQKKYLQLQY